MHVRFADTAQADLRSIESYLKPKSPIGFERIMSAILTSAGHLGQFPHIGREGRIGESYELTVPRTPFYIVYWLPDQYHVEILNVVHERQEWPPEE